jgi:hypothetical protein
MKHIGSHNNSHKYKHDGGIYKYKFDSFKIGNLKHSMSLEHILSSKEFKDKIYKITNGLEYEKPKITFTEEQLNNAFKTVMKKRKENKYYREI